MQDYILNDKTDVYSVGVLLWEISSGKPPFYADNKAELEFKISEGLREIPVPDTPNDYVKLYTGKIFYYYGLLFINAKVILMIILFIL